MSQGNEIALPSQKQINKFDEENFIRRIAQIPSSSTLIYQQTNYADGRIETKVTIKQVTAIEKILRSIALTVILIVIVGFSVISHELYLDVQAERDIQLLNATIEITVCRDDFYQNLCEPETRVPSTEEFCTAKQKCMLQNPHSMARQQMTLQVVLSRGFIAFFDVLSYKSFGFLLTFSLLLTYVVISVLKQ